MWRKQIMLPVPLYGMGSLLSSTYSSFVESLSSIMCKTQQTKCLSSMKTQMKKKMVCDNDNNQNYNSEYNNENDQKWRMNVKPFYS